MYVFCYISNQLFPICIPKTSSIVFISLISYLKVTPPIYVPKNKAVFVTLAAGSIAKLGQSWMNVAIHVNTAAKPTKLENHIYQHNLLTPANKLRPTLYPRTMQLRYYLLPVESSNQLGEISYLNPLSYHSSNSTTSQRTCYHLRQNLIIRRKLSQSCCYTTSYTNLNIIYIIMSRS